MLRLNKPKEDKVIKSTLIRDDQGEVLALAEEYSSGFIDILDTVSACEDMRALGMLTQKLSRDVDLNERLVRQRAAYRASKAA